MSFIAELKRRNVFRVAIAYIIVAWLLLQVADTLVPALHLPEWFTSGIALLLILGFPISIIFAWAFEMTPEGVKREREVDRSQSITPQTGQKLNITIIVLLAFAVAYFATDKFLLQDRQPPVDEVVQTSVNPSIAVLPFVNMSDDASNEFFADGITEELLNLLAKIPELDVTSRSSAFAFKGKDIDIPEVAAKLNVEHVLEGSVRKSGVKVRITAQLIDADTDKHMWSETYDRELTDVFAIQDEIAKKVVDVLQVTLLGRAPKSQETDAEAYSLYLEGMHYLELDGLEDWPKAQRLFEQVLAIDSDYAPAVLGLSTAVREQANFGLIDLNDGTNRARDLAMRAIEIDPLLAGAWAMLGHIQLVFEWDWAGARELAERAYSINPNNPDALALMGRVAQVNGDLDLALEYRLEALRHDPLSQILLTEVANTYFYRQEYALAIPYVERNIELNPDGAGLQTSLAIFNLFLGDADKAEAILQREVEELNRNYGVASVYHALGRTAEATKALQYIIDEHGIPLGFQIAELYAFQGMPDKAFEWLEISIDNDDGGMTYLLIDPYLVSLHDDPRWIKLVDRMDMRSSWEAMQSR